MNFGLNENLNDSMKLAKHFLNCYIIGKTEGPFTKESYLKQAILSLHHSVELYMKAKLIKKNPLLIYELKQKDKSFYNITEALKNGSISFEDHIVKHEKHILSIDYNELERRYFTFFKEEEEIYSNEIADLGRIRNELSHFGTNLDDLDNRFRIYNCIRGVILFLFSDNSELEDVRFYLHKQQEDLWNKIHSKKLDDFYKKFEDHCEELNNALHEDKFIIQLQSRNMAFNTNTPFILMQIDEVLIDTKTVYHPYLGILTIEFLGTEEDVYGIYHNEKFFTLNNKNQEPLNSVSLTGDPSSIGQGFKGYKQNSLDKKSIFDFIAVLLEVKGYNNIAQKVRKLLKIK